MRYLLFFVVLFSYGQEGAIWDRLTVLENNGKLWLNIDGYSITSEDFQVPFNPTELKKLYKKHEITNKDLKSSNPQIKATHHYASKLKDNGLGKPQVENYYFVKNKKGQVTVIWFARLHTAEKDVEEFLVNHIIEGTIPQKNYADPYAATINFAGREFYPLSCYWMALNNLQCSIGGEMNWSIYQSLEDAQKAIADQEDNTLARELMKVVSQENVEVIFEEVPTQAKKLVIELQGGAKFLAGMSGGKVLTIYYVAQQVRGRYIGCVMSFWDNDVPHAGTGLPYLLSKVMTLKK